MKILFLTHYFPPEGNAPASRVGALTEKWSAEGHEVTVVTGVPNVPDGVVYPGYENKICSEEALESGVRLLRVWTLLAPNKGFILRIANFVSYMIASVIRCMFLSKPDVVIATSPQFFCGWAGVLLKWWFMLTRPFSKRSRFVLEIRDIWPESINAVGAMDGGIAIRVLEKMEMWMYAAADHIVTVGEGYKRRLVEKGVSASKMSIVMNGVDSEILKSNISGGEVSDLRAEWGLEGKFVCSYIGTIGIASALDVYLRAAKLLKEVGNDDIRLLAVGDGAVRAELKEAAASEGLDNIVFTGRRPKSEMPLFLAASDVCFVHLRKTPLFETVIPSKIFEALGMRRPILIGVEGDAKLLVEASGGGVSMMPESESELVEKLLSLAGDEALRQRLGDVGHDFVVQNFDREKLAKEYIEVLDGELSR